MNSHATAYGLILGALVACGGASAAPAPGANTSGLTLAISKLALNQKQVTIQFTLKNNGKGRAYFFNARGDRRESGFFGSGEQINQPPPPHRNQLHLRRQSRTLPLTRIYEGFGTLRLCRAPTT